MAQLALWLIRLTACRFLTGHTQTHRPQSVQRLAAMYKTGQKHLSFPYINLLYFLLQTSHFHNFKLPRVRDCRAGRNWSNISSALN